MNSTQSTVFNPAQLYLLRLFSLIKSDDELNDIRQLISNYFSKRLDRLTEEMWNSGELNQERLDEIDGMDLHQWLREERRKEAVQ